MTATKRSHATPTNGNSQATRATRRSAYLLVGAALTLICSGVVSASTSIDQMGSDIDGERPNDRSGGSVSLSSDGTIIAIGAEQNDGADTNAGHVRIYEWNGSTWQQKGADIDGANYGSRAHEVSMSSDGTIVAIGAARHSGRTGYVRIYEWNGTAWQQKGADIDGEDSYHYFGASVSLSSDGTIIAIGASGYTTGPGVTGFDTGYVQVYEWDGTAWIQKGADMVGEAEDDHSGTSVSLSSDGTIVAIGARLNDGNGTDAGHVRVYAYDGVTGDVDGVDGWTQMGADIDGEAAGDYAGWSVALSSDGTTVANGAKNNDGNGADSGHVRVHEWNGSAWVQKGSDIDGEAADDYSGQSVALSSDGTKVAIGADFNDGNGSYAGHVRIYEWNGSAWQQTGADIDGEAASDRSGFSVAMSSDGTKVAIGAIYNDATGSSAGHVRVYSISTAAALNITYDSQGGSTVTDGDTTTTTGGSITTLPTDPTRDGYTFNGWYTATSGGTQITAGAAHNQTVDFTLYAQWQALPTTTTTVAPTTTTVATTSTTSSTAVTTTSTPETSESPTDSVELPATGTSPSKLPSVPLMAIGCALLLVSRLPKGN